MLKKILIIGVLIYTIWLLIFSETGYISRLIKYKVINDLTEEICRLRKENHMLQQKIYQLKMKDPSLIEKNARELGMLKKGEKILKIY